MPWQHNIRFNEKKYSLTPQGPQLSIFGMWQWLMVPYITCAIHAPGGQIKLPLCSIVFIYLLHVHENLSSEGNKNYGQNIGYSENI